MNKEIKEEATMVLLIVGVMFGYFYALALIFAPFAAAIDPKICELPKTRWSYVVPTFQLGCYLNEEITDENSTAKD